MVIQLKNFRPKRENNSRKLQPARKGYTLLELMLALGIVGILALVAYPSIMNSLETRDLENTARNVLTTLQRAKFQAVKSRLYCRVLFELKQGVWFFKIEREDTAGVWNTMPGFVQKRISPDYNVTLNFPNNRVVFSPLGFVSNFAAGQNSITLQSDKLQRYSQPDQRIVTVYAGGSIKYIKM